MPYIPQERRNAIIWADGNLPETSGELNFLITTNLVDYLTSHGTSYQTINDCLGALEGAKLEFYRRVAVPYEDGKREANGDVYDDSGRLEA